MPGLKVVKVTHWVSVNVRDGVPCCPCHDEPMTQVADNEWRCQLGLALERLLTEQLVPEPEIPEGRVETVNVGPAWLDHIVDWLNSKLGPKDKG